MCNFVSRGGWLSAGGLPTLTWKGAIISLETSPALIKVCVIKGLSILLQPFYLIYTLQNELTQSLHATIVIACVSSHTVISLSISIKS